ncbi:MAG: XrtA/PEP-CTERM system histidine kinase PrsK, partial [Candidatus Poribacteria bacterium]
PIYLITLAFLAFIPSELFITRIAEEYPNYQFIYGRVGYAYLFFSLSVILATLSNLEKRYRQMQYLGNVRVKYPILVLIGALSFQILIHSIAIAFAYMRIDLLTVSSLTLLIADISIAYPVLFPSPQDDRIKIGREVVSRSYTLLLAGLYLLIIGMLEKIIQLIGKNLNVFLAFSIAFIVLLMLTAALVSRSLKQRFLAFVERNFYKSRYDYRKEWENFSRRVFSTFNLEELLRETIDAVSESLKVDKSCLMLKDEDNNTYFIAASQNLSQTTITFDGDSEFLGWLWRYGKPLILSSPARAKYPPPAPPKRGESNLPEYYQQSVEPLRQLGISVCVPIIAQHDLIAILLLGSKSLRGDEYNSEDMNLLETMANQLSIAITNARLNEELIVSREMNAFQRLSAFVLHDLKSAVSMLSMLVENAEDNFDNPEFQQDALRTMSGAIAKMQNLMTKFSSVPEELKLNLQLTDISDLIRDVVAKSGVKNLSGVQLTWEFQPVPQIMIDAEYIEKVILNLITNAIEALPRGGNITLRLYSQGEFINLEVHDTGCGMSQEFINNHLFKPFQTTKDKGIGVGLYQCKVIVSAHGGKIEVDSAEGIGSTFTVKLPTL